MAHVTTAVAGNATKNNGATIVGAGSASTTTGPITNVQTLRENALRQRYENRVFLAVSPTSSGNIGTKKPYSNGTFSYDPPQVSSSSAVKVVAKRLSSTISGYSNTILKFGASDKGINKAYNVAYGDRTTGATNAAGATYDLFTGTLTKSGDGTLVQCSGLDGNMGQQSDHEFTTQGELVYIATGKTPTQKNYATRYNP